MTAKLDPDQVASLLDGVAEADALHRAAWPGPAEGRQPVQVLYVPADRVDVGTVREAGSAALAMLDAQAGDDRAFSEAFSPVVPALGAIELAARVRQRVRHKLSVEPVEDLRVDFEDGYRGHDDAEEDAHAETAGTAVARMVAAGGPPFVGVRVKSFTDGLAARSVATLDRFLGAVLREGPLPDGFAVTFPKIVSVAHVEAFVAVLAALERAHGVSEGSLGFEAQIETTASVLGADGRVALRDIRRAGAGRLRAVHFGVFDYTAAIGVPAEQQRLDHPGCDFARHLMQVTFAGSEVGLSDGSTNVRPASDRREDVVAAWRAHATHVGHSLAHGFRQGWDLDPSHLVSRYAVVFAHLLDGMDEVVARLQAWETGGAAGSRMDEPATVAVLRRRVRWATECGAWTPDDASEA